MKNGAPQEIIQGGLMLRLEMRLAYSCLMSPFTVETLYSSIGMDSYSMFQNCTGLMMLSNILYCFPTELMDTISICDAVMVRRLPKWLTTHSISWSGRLTISLRHVVYFSSLWSMHTARLRHRGLCSFEESRSSCVLTVITDYKTRFSIMMRIHEILDSVSLCHPLSLEVLGTCTKDRWMR